jgi:cell division protein FtsZ
MLEQGRLVSGAAALLIGIVGGEDLAVQEVGRVMEAVAASRGKECQTFMGTHIDPNLVDTVRLLVLVSEHWDRDVPLPAAAAETPAAGKPARRSTRSRAKSTQPTLALGVGGRGRFKNVEPTILDGEDVDVPTFLRRGIRI